MVHMMRMILFGCFLAAAAGADLKSREIPLWLFPAGCFPGLLFLADSLKIYGWSGFLAGFAPGIALLLLSHASGGAVGMGDGLFFLGAAFYLSPAGSIALLFLGIFLCGLFGAGVAVRGFFHGRGTRGCRVPFLPFLLPAFGILLFFGHAGGTPRL